MFLQYFSRSVNDEPERSYCSKFVSEQLTTSAKAKEARDDHQTHDIQKKIYISWEKTIIKNK